MRRHIFAILIASLVAIPTTFATDEAQPQAVSNLQREQSAFEEQNEESNSNIFLLLLLMAALAVPVAIVGLLLIGKKETSRPFGPDERAEPPTRRKPSADDSQPKPRTEAAETQPLADRPGLATRLQGHTPPKPTGQIPPGIKAGEHPPYFMVRATYKAKRDRMARIYVLADELLVIDAGPGSDFHAAAGVTAAVLTGGGIIGSIIGSAVGSMIADDQRTKGEVLQQKLDRLNLEGLLKWAMEDGNVRAPFADIVGVSIDAGGRSFRADGARTIGTFRFRFLKRGEYAFDFLSPIEVRGAIELVRRAMSNNFHVGSGWDEVTARCLEGV